MKKRSDGRYQKKITLSDGRQKTVYGRTLAEVNQAAAELIDQDNQGLVIGDNTLVGQWAKIWIDTYKPSLRAGTLVMYRNAYNVHIMPFIGKMPLRDVRPIHVQQVMQACADLSESMQQKILITLRQIFATARQNGLVVKDPCDGARITKHNRPEKVKHLAPEQQDILMQSITSPRALAFCGLCLYCGLRREEALGMQWGDIKAGQLTVNRAVTFLVNQPDPCQDLKTKAAHRTIPVPAPLADILAQTPQNSLYIVPTAKGRVMTQSAFKRLWQAVQSTVPFKVHPHMLRHTYAKSLCLAGVDIKKAQYLLGHSSIQMTADIYTHINAKDAEAAAALIDGYFTKSSQKVVKTQNQ